MIITIEDARKLGYCSKGMRKIAIKHSLDWQKFLKEGLDSDVLLATNDALIVKLVESKLTTNGEQNGNG